MAVQTRITQIAPSGFLQKISLRPLDGTIGRRIKKNGWQENVVQISLISRRASRSTGNSGYSVPKALSSPPHIMWYCRTYLCHSLHRSSRTPEALVILSGEVLLLWLRTWTLPTCALLYLSHLSNMPLCTYCKIPETTDHFLMECCGYKTLREMLFHCLHIAPVLI